MPGFVYSQATVSHCKLLLTQFGGSGGVFRGGRGAFVPRLSPETTLSYYVYLKRSATARACTRRPSFSARVMTVSFRDARASKDRC